MTARDMLDRRKRRVMGFTYCSIAVMFAAFLTGAALNNPGIVFIAMPLFFVGFLAQVYGYYSCFRCPWCAENMSRLV